jgi:hypothetical protein
MLSIRSRVSAVAIIMGAASMVGSARPASAEEMHSCSQSTGWCCTNSSSCTTGSYCCYFEDDVLQRETCGCSAF